MFLYTTEMRHTLTTTTRKQCLAQLFSRKNRNEKGVGGGGEVCCAKFEVLTEELLKNQFF
jgi:hypothetical protein